MSTGIASYQRRRRFPTTIGFRHYDGGYPVDFQVTGRRILGAPAATAPSRRRDVE